MRSRFLVRFHFRFQDQRWDGVMQNSIQTLNICKLNKTMVLRSLKNKTLKIVFRFANVITGVSEEEYKESYTIQKCQEGKKQRTVSIGSIRLFKHWRTTLHLVLVMTLNAMSCELSCAAFVHHFARISGHKCHRRMVFRQCECARGSSNGPSGRRHAYKFGTGMAFGLYES